MSIAVLPGRIFGCSSMPSSSCSSDVVVDIEYLLYELVVSLGCVHSFFSEVEVRVNQ